MAMALPSKRFTMSAGISEGSRAFQKTYREERNCWDGWEGVMGRSGEVSKLAGAVHDYKFLPGCKGS